MRANDLVQKVVDIARNYKTLYVYACFGAPMTNSNKNRYMGGQAIYEFNRRADRAAKIRNASSNTFGFDCVNLIKGVLWGWNGNLNHIYGGAVYGSNGVPDTNANGMFWDYCYDQSSDFSNILPGEFVWMEGHIGVHIGGGLAVECTPIWADGVQITAIGNIGAKAGYATRTWTSHGKSKFLYGTSDGDNPGSVVSNVETTITRAVAGKPFPYNTTGDLGWVAEGSISLKQAPAPQKDDLLELVKRTIRGDFGNGDERRAALGDRYDEVQRQVNLNLNAGLTRWDNIRLF